MAVDVPGRESRAAAQEALAEGWGEGALASGGND